MPDNRNQSSNGIHPAYLAAAAVVGIGCAIYSIFSSRSNEVPQSTGNSPPPPIPLQNSPKPAQYDTHPSHLKNNDGKEEDEEDMCPICLNALERGVKKLKCSHSFHLECINQMLQTTDEGFELNNKCPVCRKQIE